MSHEPPDSRRRQSLTRSPCSQRPTPHARAARSPKAQWRRTPLPVHVLLGCYTGMPLLRSGSSAQLAIPARHVPWLGTSPDKALPDHTCVFGCCWQECCPHCQLEKVRRPQPRSDGVCPCCLQSAGSATRHLCLCVKCRILPGLPALSIHFQKHL